MKKGNIHCCELELTMSHSVMVSFLVEVGFRMSDGPSRYSRILLAPGLYMGVYLGEIATNDPRSFTPLAQVRW